MRRRPPMSTRTDTLLPDATLFGSAACAGKAGASSSTGFALTDRSSASSPCLGTTRFPAPSSFDEGCSEAEFPSSGSHGFGGVTGVPPPSSRSEEHTSELQSLMRISYAVFCLKKKIYISDERQINAQIREH